jgi:hypothetical protein
MRLFMKEPDDPRTKELITQIKVLDEKIKEMLRLSQEIMERGMQLQEMVSVEGEPDRSAIESGFEELGQMIVHYKSVLSGENPQKSSELPE